MHPVLERGRLRPVSLIKPRGIPVTSAVYVKVSPEENNIDYVFPLRMSLLGGDILLVSLSYMNLKITLLDGQQEFSFCTNKTDKRKDFDVVYVWKMCFN